MEQHHKDGEVLVFEEYKNSPRLIAIVKNMTETTVRCHALLNTKYKKLHYDREFNHNGRTHRMASDAERQQLFTLLAANGKFFNIKTNEIATLDRRYNFSTLDFILVKRKEKDYVWTLHQFAFIRQRFNGLVSIHTVGGRSFAVNSYDILPYNESTSSLLGTTGDYTRKDC